MRATKPKLAHLAKPFAQRRAVGQIAAGNDQVVGNGPVEGLGNLEGRRLLSLQPIRIHRIQQVDRRLTHDLVSTFTQPSKSVLSWQVTAP